MRKILARFMAFFLDLAILTLLVGIVADLPIFDTYNNRIESIRREAIKYNDNYKKLDKEIDEILDDATVDDDEFNYIHTNFIEYRVLFDDIKPNTNIEKSYIDNIHEDIDKTYKDIYSSELFEIASSSRYQSILSIVVYILYFGVLQYVLKGQTVFKKLFRIRVVDNKDIKRKVPLWKYLVRAILVCDIIFTFGDIIAISNLSLDKYLVFNTYFSNIKFVYEAAFIMFIMLRDDQRGIHDLLLNTKIIRYDKFGKIQEDILFKLDEPSDKKEEEKKKTKKVREEVEAIKVND